MKDFLRPLEIEARKLAKFFAKYSPYFSPMLAKHFARFSLPGLFGTEEKLAPKMGILPFFLSFLDFM